MVGSFLDDSDATGTKDIGAEWILFLDATTPGNKVPSPDNWTDKNSNLQAIPTIDIRQPDSEILEVVSLNIHPNPVETTTIFTIENQSKTTEGSIQIFDLMGAKVFERNLDLAEKTSVEINLSELPAGQYLTKITAGNAEAVESLVITSP
mgnify:CR=1 FL=1